MNMNRMSCIPGTPQTEGHIYIYIYFLTECLAGFLFSQTFCVPANSTALTARFGALYRAKVEGCRAMETLKVDYCSILACLYPLYTNSCRVCM